uniref:RRM domain-containing protein n=1 Tax=Sinocyclocheilus anshuiensis TaxID=1608454 RepID=A0A671MVD6_9TELE
MSLFKNFFFLIAGPLIKVKIPKDNDGKSKQFAFVNFKHEVSVPYALNLLNGVRLYGRQLNIQFRAGRNLHFILFVFMV